MERYTSVFFPDEQPSAQEAILTTFFREVTEPVAAMIEALYLSPLFHCRRTVWEILRRMARAASVKALPPEVVTGVCASIAREHFKALRCGIEPREGTWRITWRPTSVQLRWPTPIGIKESFVVLVTEVAQVMSRSSTASEESGETERVLAFRCTPDPPSSDESGESAAKLALYDALVFGFPTGEQCIWSLSPPTDLFVQSPMPKAIQKAARVWRIKAEEIMLPGQQCEMEEEWRWERELADRVLDPVHYLRILDRAFERAYGYAPFQAKQRVTRGIGWHALPQSDPLRHCPGLGELLPSFPAVVGRMERWNGRGGTIVTTTRMSFVTSHERRSRSDRRH